MTRVRVEVLVLVLIIAHSCHSITTNSKKVVNSSGNARDTQSVTFSSNGEDQLIFRDPTFPPPSGDARTIQNPNRRADYENGADEFFERGWMPLHSYRFDGDGGSKISDQQPQENVHRPAVRIEPPNRMTKFLRFSESDIMQTPMNDQEVLSISENVIKSNEDTSEEEYEEDSSSLQASDEHEPSPLAVNLTHAFPRMLKFEESDRMEMGTRMPSVLKFSDDSTKREMSNVDSQQPANYEVYVIENLMKNTTGSLRFDNPVMNNASASSDEFSNSPRNSSRFFRFEEQDRPRVEKSPVVLKFQDNNPQQANFKFPNSDVSRAGEMHYYTDTPIKFHDTDSRPQTLPSSQMRFEDNDSGPLKFAADSPTSSQAESDQFYTVKATYQIGNWNSAAAITPPTLPATSYRPKQKKPKIYNPNLLDIRKQDGFNYQSPSEYDNFLQSAQQAQPVLMNYQSNSQIPSTSEGLPNNNPYYPTQGTPYPPFSQNNYYIQDYLSNYPYAVTNPNQQPLADSSALYPSLYPQHPNVPTNLINGGQTDSPVSAQSIFGFLQSIFNFAPGTFNSFQSLGQTGNVASADSQQSNAGQSSPIMAVSTQLRKALDNIAGNDELQCVPKLICMMSRRSSGQGFSTYVNRGLLSTVLSAVPDSSPWLKFSRAALLGYGIGANSCDIYYPKCPKDESEIIYYLNNHRGGFFRFFNDATNNANSG
ncbi:uncharacterized protein LOC131438935 [Malaya genurostris]|uniref:uncharacterized protein LOC131438935 n=1 Tax=Malaya genurostris TaxID=325434 RepID=UPI0026F40405|nr:uncharacterized protein LOC131438935 [Malaya genurostris]